jgi:hypothetical protein
LERLRQRVDELDHLEIDQKSIRDHQFSLTFLFRKAPIELIEVRPMTRIMVIDFSSKLRSIIAIRVILQ